MTAKIPHFGNSVFLLPALLPILAVKMAGNTAGTGFEDY